MAGSRGGPSALCLRLVGCFSIALFDRLDVWLRVLVPARSASATGASFFLTIVRLDDHVYFFSSAVFVPAGRLARVPGPRSNGARLGPRFFLTTSGWSSAGRPVAGWSSPCPSGLSCSFVFGGFVGTFFLLKEKESTQRKRTTRLRIGGHTTHIAVPLGHRLYAPYCPRYVD